MLRISKAPNETWLDAAVRRAKPWGLEQEVTEAFQSAKQAGCDDAHAAFHACSEWDILDLTPPAHTEGAA